MNLDKKIKMLLLIVNQRGLELNYEVVNRYNQELDAITSEYHLKRWYKNDKAKDGKVKYYCKDTKFRRIDQVVKYLLAIKNNEEPVVND